MPQEFDASGIWTYSLQLLLSPLGSTSLLPTPNFVSFLRSSICVALISRGMWPSNGTTLLKKADSPPSEAINCSKFLGYLWELMNDFWPHARMLTVQNSLGYLWEIMNYFWFHASGNWFELVQMSRSSHEFMSKYLSSVISRRYCFTVVFPDLWLLQSLWPLFCNGIWVFGWVYLICGWTLRWHSLYLNHLWVFALTTIHYTKKLLWWGLRATLDFRYRNMNL